MMEIDDSEAVEKSHVELYRLLCEHFDDKLSSPEKGMLAGAAEFVAASALPWSSVVRAINNSWGPRSDERIVEHLFAGVGVELTGDKDIWHNGKGQWATELRCSRCGTTWERELEDRTVDWLDPETWTCPRGCNADERVLHNSVQEEPRP